MYGKIFESIYDGTLAEDWRALITFEQMVVLCDSDGVLDMTPAAIARRTGIPVELIEAGIEILERPDPQSRTPDEDGRRIIRLDEHRPWGWRIVNHQRYRDLDDYGKVKAQNRDRQRRYREKQRGEDNVTSRDGNAKSRHTNTNTDTKNTPSKKRSATTLVDPDGFDRFWTAYPRKRGKGDARKAWTVLKPDPELQQRILQAIDAAKRTRDWRKDDGRFIPYPATWLRAEGWDDDYRPADGHRVQRSDT